MAEIRDPKRPVNQNNRPNNPNNKGVKPPKSRYIIYIVYGLLFVGIFFLWNGSSKVEPIKKEWLDFINWDKINKSSNVVLREVTTDVLTSEILTRLSLSGMREGER